MSSPRAVPTQYVSSDLSVPVSRVSLGNVVIGGSDEMPGNGRLAERLDRDKECSPPAIGWLDGVVPRPFENDPQDPVTPDSRAGPVLAPFRSTIESCISVVLLWAALGSALRPWRGCPRCLIDGTQSTIRVHLNDFEVTHK